jgi:glycerol dehydrogenase
MSHLMVFASPERYVQGRNATSQLGEEMRKLGMEGPIVILTSGSPRRLLEDTWARVLPVAGFQQYQIIDFGGICTDDEVQRVAKAAKEMGAKTLIAAGGGQVIDTIRAASMLHKSEVVSCPTVASTDAPCSVLCVLYHKDHSLHEYRFNKRHPTLVLVDTSVIAHAPRRMLVGGLGDALATWFEARTVKEAHTNNFVNGLQTETAGALSNLCYEILLEDGPAAVQAVDVNAVTPALERVVEANTLLSGLGFESGGLCVAHSVHNGLTSQAVCSNYTHGEKVAFGLLTQLILEGRPNEEVERILDYCKKVGLPITLKEVGIATDSNKEGDLNAVIAEIAERAVAPGESSHNEPFEVTAEMMADSIRAADRRGTLYHLGKST